MNQGKPKARALALVAGAAAMALGAGTATAGDSGEVGAAGLGDPFFPKAGNGGYDVKHYGVALRYRPARNRLQGRARIRARVELEDPANGTLRRFNLDYRGPRIRSVLVDGARAGFARQGGELIVTPATAPAEGSRFDVAVRYAGRPRALRSADGSLEGWIRTGDGAVALGEPQGSTRWFPANNHPLDKASFRTRLTTPRNRLGVANGRLVKRRGTPRRTTTVWKQPAPMAAYLATVAIGRYRLDRARMGDTPYLAVADPDLPGRTLRLLRERTRRARDFMVNVAGEYPFGATGGIADPSRVGYALETQTRPYYPSLPSRDLVVHEIAHEWFGNSVSLAEWDEIWLNEGFATYMEWLFVERRGTGRHAGPRVERVFDRLYAAHGAGDTAFWNPPPADPGSPERMFSESIYTRAGMALQVLREEIGNQSFFALLRDWAAMNRYGNVTTDDLRGLIELHNSGSVPPLFEQWIFDPGKPPAP